MPTFEKPSVDADEAQQALRGLAHATRSIKDPQQLYPTLGSVAAAAASMSQSLHQLASFHDGPARRTGWAPGDSAGDSAGARAASYRVSWELHRAGEILRYVSEAISHAQEAEATLVYHRELPDPGPVTGRAAVNGIDL
ncbi:hypothetical protein [Nocardioides caldifontis]|uniref:hypothetical protein n=1 Tax=Nocardioides caldifontis TaxID=2588938 RepID=UPI0011E049A6|nr:hypothetical protein [Nocardioides caldifontis]